MKRRKALFTIGALGGLTALTVMGYKWIRWNGSPDLDYLVNQKQLLRSLVERIIPATEDSPGAMQANVHEFVIKMITDCADVKVQNKFIDGLQDLQQFAFEQFGKSFENCLIEQQDTVLVYFENKDEPFPGIIGKAQNKFLGKSFFTTLKEYTSVGYFTSEVGATKGLRYLYIPGKYEACQLLKPGEKSWATS